MIEPPQQPNAASFTASRATHPPPSEPASPGTTTRQGQPEPARLASPPACSTSTASSPRRQRSTRQPGSRCSTRSCWIGRGRPVSRSAPSRSPTTTPTYVDGKLRQDGVRVVPGIARDRAAGGLGRRPANGAHRPRSRDAQERPRARPDRTQTVSRCTKGRCGSCEAVRDAGLRRAVVSASKNCQAVLVAAGIEDLFEVRDRRRRRRRDGTARQACARHVPGRRRRAGRRSCAVRRLRGRRRRRRSGPRRRVRLGRRRRPRRATPTRCAATAPTRSSATSSELLERAVIEPGVLSVEPWAVTEPSLRLDLLGADRVDLRAVERAHRSARQPRRGGAARRPGHLPERILREPAAALRRARATAIPRRARSLIDVTNGKLFRLLVDDEPFDVRYGTLLRHERVLDLRDGVLRRERGVGLADRAEIVRIRSTRLVSFVQRAVGGGPLRGRSGRRSRPASSCSRPSSPTSRCPSRRTIRAPPPRCARRSSASITRTTISRSRSGTARAAAGCGWRPRSTTSSTGRPGR